jgi:hypothetical protein
MRNNNLLTYILYALLGAFILAAGYYACEKQKEKKEQAAREAAELEETLREMGYASDEETDTGSSHSGSDSIPPSVAKPVAPQQKPGGSATPPPATKDIKPTAAPAPSTKSNSSTAVAPKISTPQPPSTVKGPGSGRWAVRAGTFSVTDGARKRLEQVIKAGYPNAEISKTKDGKAAVVVFRSNDKAAATRVANDLTGKGIDAAVFDRQN